VTLHLRVAPHPLLDVGAFVTRLPAPLETLETPTSVRQLCEAGASAPVAPSDEVRAAIRALLRHGGYKPSGRGKPASEYLGQALGEGRFPAINLAVDVCNAVSLHSALPISVVDAQLLEGDLSIQVVPEGTAYVFNPSGQTIDASGLLCLCDQHGPSGTAVKDAQRTKTGGTTVVTLSVIWGSTALGDRTARTTAWYRELLGAIPGVVTEDVALIRSMQVISIASNS
jgi:DNA/RNA-binding domain of Phe-tRNA-synthetase-like protein